MVDASTFRSDSQNRIESYEDPNRLIVPDQENVPILDHINFVFRPHQIVRLDLALTSEANEILNIHGFGANKALGQIGVDAVCRVEGCGTTGNQDDGTVL